DIDSLNKSMNYVPVDAGIISTNISGTKGATSQEVKKNVSSLRYTALPNWAHDALLESSSSKPQDHCSTEVPEGSGNPNPTASTSNPLADPIEILTVETPIPTVSLPVPTAYSTNSQEPSSDTRLILKRVANQEETPSLDNILSLINRFEDILGLCREFEALMHEKFQMSAMGELNFFLGLQVLQKEDDIFLSQDKYVGDILKKFRYSDVRSSNTPMDKENPWGKDRTGKDVDLHLYRSMIGSLMYLTASRPDIMFAICACARHQVTPKECHLHAVKRIFIYLKGYPKLGLWYPKESPFDLVAYSDSDYGGATQDCKSTTGGCLLLIIEDSFLTLEKSEHNVDFHPMVDFIEASPLSPSFSGRIVPLFDTMLVQQGEGLGIPTEPHHTPSPEAQPPSHTTYSLSTLPPVTTTSIPAVTLSDITPIRKYTRRARIAQSSTLLTVADEHGSPLRDISQGEACPTDSGFIADQDRATIAKSSTLPYDSAPRVTSPATAKGSMQQTINELTALCTSLQRQYSELAVKFEAREIEITRLKARVKHLEDRQGVAAEGSGDDALIKGRNLDEEEAATERASDDTKEMATVLTSMDAVTVLASDAGPPAAEVPTGSDVVPTVSPVFATATVIDAQVAKELEEQLEREDQRRSEQIARDAEIARIHAEEELQIMIDGLDRNNETVAKYLQEYHQFASELPIERRIELISDLVKYQDNYAKIYKFQSQQRKPLTKKKKRDYYMAVIRSNLGWKMEDFIPMGSKEDAERIKRKGLSLEQESTKKQKTSDEVTEEAKSPDEVPEEKVKEMMQLVPIEEVYVEALQVKHPIINWKVHTEGQRSYWKITRLGGSSASYQFFIDLLKHLDREDLNQLWRLETLSNRLPTSDKEMELWVELSRLYEPDDEDQLWTHTQNLMCAPVEWKLYDSCGVHHVTSKDKEIFMLVEKDYPLRKGLALVMISYKLQMIILFWKLDCSWSIKFKGGLLGIKCTRHSHCQVTQFGSTALIGAGVGDGLGAENWFFLSSSNALTISLSSTTSDETAGVEEFEFTLATTALARV
nr:hypothetical protein [Tanacetum cinerariifolium]